MKRELGLKIHKEPFFYQTYWFYALCFLLGCIDHWRNISDGEYTAFSSENVSWSILSILKTQEIATKNYRIRESKRNTASTKKSKYYQ